MRLKVYVVRKLGIRCPACRAVVLWGNLHDCHDGHGNAARLFLVEPTILSAWIDVYSAKHEAQRWETDSKVPHDFIEGTLELPVPA